MIVPLPQTPPKKSFVKEYWYVFFLIGAFGLLLIAQIFRALTPPAPAPLKDNSWNELTPGYSSYQDVQTKLGQPLASNKTARGTELSYQSQFPSIPTQVVINDENKVTFIKERLPYDPEHTLQAYIDKLGTPDLELYIEESEAIKAHVFLAEGLVIVAHISDKSVEQKWYFEPTDKDTFLASWGQALSENQPGPESLNQ